jgi:pSer/pThr/pTyr-binding forkhead associated (FHA) protein
MWILKTIGDSEDPGLTFRVMPDGMKTLGRAVRADFILDAPLVSRLHCRLSVDRTGGLEVEDLDSTNGTFVNGRRIKRSVLATGDRLRVGRVEMTVEREEKGEAGSVARG